MLKEDLDVFLNSDEFAVEVCCSDPERTFAAIFDDVGSVSTIGGMVVENANATLTCAPASVAGFVWERTEVEVAGHGTFTVVRIRPDGGMMVAELEQ